MFKSKKVYNKNKWMITTNLNTKQSVCGNLNQGVALFSKTLFGATKISLYLNQNKFFPSAKNLDAKTFEVMMSLHPGKGEREATEQEAILLDGILSELYDVDFLISDKDGDDNVGGCTIR